MIVTIDVNSRHTLTVVSGSVMVISPTEEDGHFNFFFRRVLIIAIYRFSDHPLLGLAADPFPSYLDGGSRHRGWDELPSRTEAVRQRES